MTAVFEDDTSIYQYVDILINRGVEWGLLGPREPARIWERHILNSVALAQLIPGGARVIDVGSGAGLPGLPLAIARPDLNVTLLEPLLRRYDFLCLAVEELGLGNRVDVVRGRAEEWPRANGTFDAVTSRAVAPLDKLVGWTRRLRGTRGEILALKGESAVNEIRAATPALRRWNLRARAIEVRADPRCEPTTVVQIVGAPS